jgi:hypothetical protein
MKTKIARKIRRLNTRRTRTLCESAFFVCLIVGLVAFEANCLYSQKMSSLSAAVTSVLPSDFQANSSAGLQLYRRADHTVAAQQTAAYLDILSVERATMEIDPAPLIGSRRSQTTEIPQVILHDKSMDPADEDRDGFSHLAEEIPVIHVPTKVLPAAFDQAGNETAWLYQYPATASPPLTMPHSVVRAQ